MTVRYYPFDSGAGANVTEAGWALFAKRFLGTGVIPDYLNQLAVSADGTAMAVVVASGGAFVEGFYYESDAAQTFAVTAANATNPRIDLVVVRLDTAANTIAATVLTGTAAASPTPPALTQTAATWEMPLAQVRVNAAVGTIAASAVTDRRALAGATWLGDQAAYLADALA